MICIFFVIPISNFVLTVRTVSYGPKTRILILQYGMGKRGYEDIYYISEINRTRGIENFQIYRPAFYF